MSDSPCMRAEHSERTTAGSNPGLFEREKAFQLTMNPFQIYFWMLKTGEKKGK